ncbi:GNAT family N-acetyltransferase [Peribacillus deserti]|uniref:GNAT family N-acetyltransferase n=1 Tax=Peribacillus deserti TaxID=673318 RepID=A0A2N5M6G3_9BACI|nr:GNAT family N-acetyltransferase [Peribacillus deserti]PLT29958.1 GNAT family N-acetyltransferase [Peribacillus deserti]
MNQLLPLEKIVNHSFKILNGLPDYINIEEKHTEREDEPSLENKIASIINFANARKVNRIGAIIQKSSNNYQLLTRLLKKYKFEFYASRIEVQRDLHDIEKVPYSFEWRSIGSRTISEEDFKTLWSRCMTGSANAASTLSIDEHLSSVKSELGTGWEHSCLAVFIDGEAAGISIPHLEPGTAEEGRIFYFGLIPEQRGKGISAEIHYQSLRILREKGASYYVGSTHESNLGMQAVFWKNGCMLKGHVESYYRTVKM